MMDDLQNGVILALDVGDVRIGVALASLPAALASPYGVVANNVHVWQALENIISNEHVTRLIIGLPRNLDGQDTTQTTKIRQFARQAEERLGLPVNLQDEALTSKKAETELLAAGSRYNKTSVDALAATYILEDYLSDKRGA